MRFLCLSAVLLAVVVTCLAEGDDDSKNRTRRWASYDDGDDYDEDDYGDDHYDDDYYHGGYDPYDHGEPVYTYVYKPSYYSSYRSGRSYGYRRPKVRHGYHVYPTYSYSPYRSIFQDYGHYLFSEHHDDYGHGGDDYGHGGGHSSHKWKRDVDGDDGKKSKSSGKGKNVYEKDHGKGHKKRHRPSHRIVKVPVYPYYPSYRPLSYDYGLPYRRSPHSFGYPSYTPAIGYAGPHAYFTPSYAPRYGHSYSRPMSYSHQGYGYPATTYETPYEQNHYGAPVYAGMDQRYGLSYVPQTAHSYGGAAYGYSQHSAPQPASSYGGGGNDYSQHPAPQPASSYGSGGHVYSQHPAPQPAPSYGSGGHVYSQYPNSQSAFTYGDEGGDYSQFEVQQSSTYGGGGGDNYLQYQRRKTAPYRSSASYQSVDQGFSQAGGQTSY